MKILTTAITAGLLTLVSIGVSNAAERGTVIRDTYLYEYSFQVEERNGQPCKLQSGSPVMVSDRTIMFGKPVIRLMLAQRPYNCSGWTRPENYQANLKIYTTGNWGNDVPVFRDRNSYFNARDRNKIENVVCRLKKGEQVKFTPYRDWGLGEVVSGNCRGWIDRGVIR